MVGIFFFFFTLLSSDEVWSQDDKFWHPLGHWVLTVFVQFLVKEKQFANSECCFINRADH